MDSEPFDVIIVGAGISGINAAYRVQAQFPNCRYAILEARESMGGTWDLFKYPGIRSDSDLFTFGFSWFPWDRENPIAEGPSIVQYLHRASAKYGIDKQIRYQHRLLGADWSSADQLWSLSVDNDGQSRSLSARFVIFGTGYYDYHNPLQADIPNLESFGGEVIHPQFWPEDLDYTDKNIVLIGSGATAITLLPKLAQKAARVTMLQRSPTYILSLPNRNRSWLSWILPNAAFRRVQRMSWFLTSQLFFFFCQTFPTIARFILRLSVSRQLPASVPFAPHFKPRYNPWDQRLCVCPDGDFFRALHTDHADVKTDTIRTVTKTGVELNSGETLSADLIVTATGLRLQIAGGTSITVDGVPVQVTDKFLWHGMMMQDLPNAAFVIGYTNASWTLGADATALFVCRLLQEMQNRGSTVAVPRVDSADVGKLQPRRLLNLNSTYVTRAEGALPKAADRGPWVPRENYLQDVWFAEHGPMTGMEFVGTKKTL
ncbi:FAD/NAD(P)-binding domain-containing protein [Aspergillus ellipticus CBS 707.79]|uniref:FAD/NAD(P)-binding domain-containing protein n=1 Tax=Aspergillus ellipticus CBS 707.79 TaxID=1448320 RepID=A0A319D8Q4_9EURO|nr:FAD/NAD(P)-binding domain-containing protein [Aspergillus ellipticus CBS 707.79]